MYGEKKNNYFMGELPWNTKLLYMGRHQTVLMLSGNPFTET